MGFAVVLCIVFSVAAIAEQITVNVPCWPVAVAKDSEEYAEFSGENIQYLTQSGEPALPYHIIKVLLPPNADLATVSVSVKSKKFEEMVGVWTVRPTPPLAPQDGKKGDVIWPEGKTIVNGRDVNIYGRDKSFPEHFIGRIHTGQMRKWKIVEIPVTSYQYNPVTKKLYLLTQSALTVNFEGKPLVASALKTILADRIGEGRVKNLTVNFEDIAPAYQSALEESALPLEEAAPQEEAHVGD